MKILWVEDFGQNIRPSTLIEDVFGDFLSGIDHDRDYTEIGPQLADLFAKHTLHEIHVCRSYLEWKEIDEQQSGDFDIALIDINLESFKTPKRDWPKGVRGNFNQRAGFYIYHQLIKRGFPDDNIAFFTAEGKSLTEFTEYCGDILLDQPAHCFEKKEVFFGPLRQWLAEKAAQPSLILRRGVLEGCRFMKERIALLADNDLESQITFYKTTSKDISNDPEAAKQQILDYLTKLAHTFRAHQNYDQSQSAFLFVRELAAKWEGSAGYFVPGKETPRFETKLDERFCVTSQFLMKRLRNWSEHQLLSANLTERDIAYFFMLAMRSLVKGDLRQVLPYEKILGLLFPDSANVELSKHINLSLEYRLKQSYGRLTTLYAEMRRYVNEPVESRRYRNHFLEEFKALGDFLEKIRRDETLSSNIYEIYLRRIQDLSLSLFYQSYWHGLFPLYVERKFYANLQSVGFNLEPIPESVLSFFGRLILYECFSETLAPANVA